MKTPHYILYTLLILFFACQQKQELAKGGIISAAELLSPEIEEIPVSSSVFYSDTAVLNDPWSFGLFKHTLIVLDRDTSTFFSVIDLKTRQRVRRFLKMGKGPNEFLSPMFIKNDNQTFYILDRDTRSVSHFHVDSVLRGSDSPLRTLKLSLADKEDFCYGLAPFQDGFLAMGSFAHRRYQVLDKNGKHIRSFGSYPAVESIFEYDDRHLGFVFGAGECVAYNSELQRHFSSSRVSAEVFSTKTDESNPLFRLQWFIPKLNGAFKDAERLIVLRDGENYPIGTGDAIANKNFVFVNYSSYTFQDLDTSAPANEFNYILVFDWNGQFISRLKLDTSIAFVLEFGPNRQSFLSTQVDEETGFKRIVQIPIPEKFLSL